MDCTNKTLEKPLEAKTPNVLESVREDNTEQLGIHSLLADNEIILEKIQRYFTISKETIENQKKKIKMLNFEIRIKEIQIDVANQAVREKDDAIKILKTQLHDKHREHSDKNTTETNPQYTHRGNSPELMCGRKVEKYYQSQLSKALKTLGLERQRNFDLLGTIRTLRELIKILTTSSVPSSAGVQHNLPPFLQSEHNGNGSDVPQTFKSSLYKGK